MARLEWVKQRLFNWALWKERDKRHGLGFYSQSAFLRIAVDCGGERDALFSTVDEVEAMKTDEAVHSLVGTKPQVLRTPRSKRLSRLRVGRARTALNAPLFPRLGE